MLRILDPSTGELLAEIEESADAAVLTVVGAARTVVYKPSERARLRSAPRSPRTSRANCRTT
jgi:hypothetical protein